MTFFEKIPAWTRFCDGKRFAHATSEPIKDGRSDCHLNACVSLTRLIVPPELIMFIAALASPTGLPFSVATMKTLAFAGSYGIGMPSPAAKIEKKTMAFGAAVRVADGPGEGGLMHTPELFVWQIDSASGRFLGGAPKGVSVGVKVTVPDAPRFSAAVTIRPVPVVPLIAILPS